MARKSKQSGGHNPLTAHEVKRLKYSGYGTQTTRLSTASHLPFGHCCLSLSPIVSTHNGGSTGAVATPSGHVYSREAILQYLLTKNAELRSRRAEYDRLRSVVENRRAACEEERRSMKRAAFLTKDQGAMNGDNSNNSATTALVLREDRQTNDTITTGSSGSSAATPLNNNSKRVENSLSHVSYWLASSQPSLANKKRGDDDDVDDITEFDYLREIGALPPSRPSSPMSGEPLRLKQLVPLHLSYEGDGSSNSNEYDDDMKSSSSSSVSLTNNTDGRRRQQQQQQQQSKKRGGVICSVSHKKITTQPIIALHGHVMLRDMYERYALPTLTCPITGRKFNVKKDVIELVAGRSGYAASGTVVAKKYNPTLT